DDEIERNPLLERADPADEPSIEPDAEPPAVGGADGSDWFAEDNSALDAETIAGEFDASLENIFPEEPGTIQPIGPDLTQHWKSAGGGLAAPTSVPEAFELEDVAAQPRTLRDHVGEQISLAFASPVARLIATELADGLDEAGYLDADTVEIASRLG